MNSRYKVAAVSATWLAPLILSLTAQGQAIRVTICPNEKRQIVTTMGCDMERSSEALMDARDPAEIVSWAFQDIPFNLCRVKYDKHQELVESQPRFEFYEKQVAAMRLVRKANPRVQFFATQRSDYNGYKEGDGNNFPTWVYNPKSRRFDASKHGRFLADFVTHLHREGVSLAYMSTGKEITQILTPELAVQSIESMDQVLERENIPAPRMVEPCAWSLPQAIEFIAGIRRLDAERRIYAYASHNYRDHSETDWSQFVEAAHKIGAEAWNGESSMRHIDNGSAEPPFERELDSMSDRMRQYRAGINGEIFFELWSRGVGKETRPIYFRNGTGGTRMRSYYLIKRWVESASGATVIETTLRDQPLAEAVSFLRGKTLTLWVANLDAARAMRFSLDLRDASTSDDAFEYIYWSDETPAEGTMRRCSRRDVFGEGMESPPHSLLALSIDLSDTRRPERRPRTP